MKSYNLYLGERYGWTPFSGIKLLQNSGATKVALILHHFLHKTKFLIVTATQKKISKTMKSNKKKNNFKNNQKQLMKNNFKNNQKQCLLPIFKDSWIFRKMG